jgi:hypothetical protein
MKLSHIVVAVVLVVVAVYAVSQRSGATEITQTGNDLSIAIGKNRLQARIAGPEFTESFLVIGGIEHGPFHFSTLLSVIPLDIAQSLANRYGDFRRCGSPGAAAGMRSVEPMILYAASGSVERRLRHINELALAGKDPVVEMTFALLDITDHKIVQRGHEMQVPPQDLGPSFLVKEARLIRKGLTP